MYKVYKEGEYRLVRAIDGSELEVLDICTLGF